MDAAAAIIEMDRKVAEKISDRTTRSQENAGRQLVNVVTLDKADEQIFLKTWQDDAAFMKRQPGFISTQLHRALGESPTYLNYAIWESTAHYRAAFGHPEFRAKLPTYPSSVVASPHLFQKVAVPNICVA
jgi:heme-degrading monooxygenase HmoA